MSRLTRWFRSVRWFSVLGLAFIVLMLVAAAVSVLLVTVNLVVLVLAFGLAALGLIQLDK